MSSLVRNLSQEHTMASSVCPSYQAAEENKDLLAPSWGREREALAAHRFGSGPRGTRGKHKARFPEPQLT